MDDEFKDYEVKPWEALRITREQFFSLRKQADEMYERTSLRRRLQDYRYALKFDGAESNLNVLLTVDRATEGCFSWSCAARIISFEDERDLISFTLAYTPEHSSRLFLADQLL